MTETTATEIAPEAVLTAIGVTGARVLGPVHGGWDTTIWRVARSDKTFALRVFRPEQVTRFTRECDVLRAAGEAGLPVPEVAAFGLYRDRPAMLLSWCPGVTLLQALRAKPWQVWSLGVAFGRAQAAIHACPVPPSLVETRDGWLEWAGPDEAILRDQLRAIARPTPALLHLDYHPLNVMIDGGRVSGILDWVNAAAGDPRADLARTVTILRLAPTRRGGQSRRERAARWLLERAWRHGYEQLAGPIGNLDLFYAWAGAAMLRDLTPRVGQPDLPLTEQDLGRIREWVVTWKRRAGCPLT